VTQSHAAVTPTSSAVEIHDRLAAAYHAQRERLAPPADMWAGCAANFKPDLSGKVNPFVEKVASFLRAEDVLIDVGGGAGRLSLPLAGRCREIVCVDPSPGMGEVFNAAVEESGIRNARFVPGGWPDTPGIEGDIALVAHVTYFVTSIRPFLQGLNEAVRRRVLVGARSIAPPNQIAPFFELVRGEKLAPVPGPEELLAVLREMGINAEVIDNGVAPPPATAPIGSTAEDAVGIEVGGGLRLGWIKKGEEDRAGALFLEHFDELFVETDEGIRRRSGLGARELIITWETRS
jgi:hypothetical protein